MRVLVTGSAGFVGFHVARRLLAEGHTVAGVDSMVPYYDVALKQGRHAVLSASASFRAHVLDIADNDALTRVIEDARPEVVIHLAAQAGVRYSLEHPESYLRSNVVGTFNLLELCRKHPVRHLLMASTSSAYGASTEMPFVETQRADAPLTIYAATKRATELMAHSTAHLWKQPITAFRFFTVYGPWGRPDMALFRFVKAALEGQPIEVYGHGKQTRDFTYVDDLVEAIIRLIPAVPEVGQPSCEGDSLSPVAPYRLVNIGAGTPIGLMDFVDAVERAVGRPIEKRMLDMQPGDVPATWADATLLEALTGYRPATPVAEGVARFVAWYRDYYRA
ncbi:SDR family NAD(P)-dependent oxidoreductase [Roseomonas sp. CCTCC AB2023176]|uniref:SDR family NAD(P)-dependent oxidoreductase n=1 Tax=Roseomonas sp. CCTCC AB2023176 TaxID=3342640 RepID=UPI0035DB58D9